MGARHVRPTDFEIIASWRHWLLAMGHSENTVRIYTYGAFRFLSEFVQGPLGTATEAHVTAFLMSLSKFAVAKSKYFIGVRSLFGYCVPRGYVEADPTTGIRLAKPKHRPRVVLSEEELYRIFCCAWERSPRRAWAIAASFGLGTRRSEIAQTSPEDVHDDVVELLHCKGGKARTVPLTDMARAGIEGLRPWWNGTILGGIKPQTLTEWAKTAARDAGLLQKVRGRPTHIFRATYVTYLLRRGVPVTVVRDLVGHESIATTNIYADTDPDELVAGAARLNSRP